MSWKGKKGEQDRTEYGEYAKTCLFALKDDKPTKQITSLAWEEYLARNLEQQLQIVRTTLIRSEYDQNLIKLIKLLMLNANE